MRILIIGAGGREHALAWKIAQSPKVEKIYAAPGNDGMAALAEPVIVDCNSMEALAAWAEAHRIDLTVVGSEVYLALGITDLFAQRGLKVFGPSLQAAKLESSKIFAKRFMTKYGIPTAAYEVFTDPKAAVEYIEATSSPLVIKAAGLAAGKGVVVASTREEAKAAVHQLMEERVYGDAGKEIIIEERLEGEEVTLLALSDGKELIPLIPAQDHKRLLDGDRGPNTGGMGAYAPASVLTPELLTQVEECILRPVIQGMAKEGHPYVGLLYAGLMITASGPQVIEFNVRFGDPEAQVVLPLLRNDLVELMLATLQGELHRQQIEWEQKAAACVVLASQGYPVSYEGRKEITGLAAAENLTDLLVFHAGTKFKGGKWWTAGGRVLNLVGLGADLAEALHVAYQGAELVKFEGVHFRSDIGWRELAKLSVK
ncbi:MAG: phosphoribosylamine--glycine ligase [Firmicutes bacterium]|nr:phosphoribosylamine--glycine ligase [Bacillota bacterium]